MGKEEIRKRNEKLERERKQKEKRTKNRAKGKPVSCSWSKAKRQDFNPMVVVNIYLNFGPFWQKPVHLV